MGYITSDYYINTYNGADAGFELGKYIERASDLIDQVTGYKIKDFDSLPPFVQEQVKKATAAQVEFYVMQGGDEAVNAGQNDLGRVGIGGFSYTRDTVHSATSESKDANRVSPAALAYLEPTGLLYRGLDVVQNVWY
ncbi:protein gp8 [Caldalkalibacillus thermarum TA2.A1]|uniref:Protein gp8 n=1 Tax=Caldalkalibacillus thermarum (strain TA2.A1) TaxID=986075 RepID=F5L4I5_CALTT|nr:hypothetical protein [Caldalkalibacillus thermarum]EGL83731.1 protein gp8 [Caldalkalibacillus thermarum TA2.A1]QZT33990.1 hypothetical protein HUR95_00680 [Caldalkalibacillus thermarum TA2.A1]